MTYVKREAVIMRGTGRFAGRFALATAASLVATTVVVLAPLPGAVARPRPVEPSVDTVRLQPAGGAAVSSTTAGPGSERLAVAAEASTEVDHFAVVGVTWDEGEGFPDDAVVQARSRDAGRWSTWTELPRHDDHAPDPDSAEAAAARPGTEPLVVGDVDEVEVRVLTDDGEVTGQPQVEVVDPGTSPADATVGTARPGQAGAAAARPGVFTRADWGADESMRGAPTYGTIRGGFVHHTVNSNSYSAADVPGVIRGIYAYHVNSRGWKDIGYNFLVDRFGRIWEGRYGGIDRPVIGAHTAGYNDVAFAMSAIGTFTTTVPSQAVLDAYARLFAWKLQLHGVDPGATVSLNGRSFAAISGHRDAGSTECPGRALYDRLSTIRGAARALVGSPPRLAGADAGQTAVAIARTAYPGSTSVVVASGEPGHLVDGLVAAPYAAWRSAPVLLATRAGVPASTADEIRRRGAGTAVVIGGELALPATVVDGLRAAGVTTVTRLAGPDAVGTAAAVARAMGSRPEAFVVSGADGSFVDSVSAGGVAAHLRAPILLTARDTVPEATRSALSALGVDRTAVVGGTAVVSSAVEQSLPSPTRLAGPDAPGTAAAVASWSLGRGIDGSEVVVTASEPWSLSDGIAGGTLRRPVLLVTRDAAPAATLDWLRGRTSVRSSTVLGGPLAVSDAVARATFPPVR